MRKADLLDLTPLLAAVLRIEPADAKPALDAGPGPVCHQIDMNCMKGFVRGDDPVIPEEETHAFRFQPSDHVLDRPYGHVPFGILLTKLSAREPDRADPAAGTA